MPGDSALQSCTKKRKPSCSFLVSLIKQADNIAAGHHVLGETASGGAQQTSYSNYSNSSFSSNSGGGHTGAVLYLSLK